MAPRPITERRIFSRLEPSCLYPDEKELAVLIMGEARAAEWPTIAKVEERAGLPRISLQYGGRFWPAVLEFYLRRHRLLEHQSSQDDKQAKENFDAVGPRRRVKRPPEA